MIEQIKLQQEYIDVVLNCFSPTVIFSQNPPTEIAQSTSAVIQSATGLATLDFAFSKTQRPAGGAFLGGGRTADREIVLTIRPNNIYDAKTLLNQLMGCQHRSKTSIYVLYAGEWFSGTGYISKIEGALFDKDLDIKITYTMGDPLFYAGTVDMKCDTGWTGNMCIIDARPHDTDQVLYQSPVYIRLTFNSPKEQLAQLSKISVVGRREATPFVEYNFLQDYATYWTDKLTSNQPVSFVLDGTAKIVTWSPASLNYVKEFNLVQRADRSLRFPYICLASDSIVVRCEFRAELSNKNIDVVAWYKKTRSGF